MRRREAQVGLGQLVMRRGLSKSSTQSPFCAKVLLLERSRQIASVACTGSRKSLYTASHNNTSNIKIPVDSLIPIPTYQLLDQTNILLDQDEMSDVDLLAVLTDWLHHHHDQPEVAAPNMQLLVEHWMGITTRYTTSQPFLLLLQRLARDGQGRRAALVLDTWIGKLGGNLSLSPTLQAFHYVLHGYSRSPLGYEITDSMLEIVSFLERQEMTPTIETYSLLLIGFQREHATKIWTEKIVSTIASMDKQWDMAIASNRQTPEQIYYYLRGYAQAMSWAMNTKQWTLGKEWYAKISHRILEQPDLVHSAMKHHVLPYDDAKDQVDQIIGHLACDYLAMLFRLNEYQAESKKRGEPSMTHALAVLHTITSLLIDHLPWANHYSVIIEMWSRTHHPGLLDFICHVQHLRLEQNKQIPIAWYSLTLRYANKMKLPNECELLLQRVMTLHSKHLLRGATSVELTRCWNHVLLAVPPDRIPALWAEFNACHMTPNYITYNAVLWGFARAQRHPRAVHEATAVLRTMADAGLPPQGSHYGAVISAWTQSYATEAANQADELLQELELKYCQTNHEWDEPRIDLYTNVINAYGRSKTPLKALNVFERMKELDFTEIDVVVYGALINALSQGKNVEAATKAEEVLMEMEHEATKYQKPELQPNVHIYTACIKAWSLSKAAEAPLRAERLLGRLEDLYEATGRKDLKPDAICYMSLVDSWARSLHQDAGQKAETWLRRFQDSGGVMNRVIYTNVIAAWWRSKAAQPQRALDLLQEMKDGCANGNTNVAPDAYTYTTVIQTIAASSMPDKAVQAWKLLEEMCHSYEGGNATLKPTVYPCTAVLSACAYSRDPAHASDTVRVALLVLNMMQNQGITPSHICYRTALNVFVIRKVDDIKMTQEKEQIVKVVFQKCCHDGQVHPDIIEFLRKHHHKVYDRIPKDRETGQIQIPPEWTINVKEK